MTRPREVPLPNLSPERLAEIEAFVAKDEETRRFWTLFDALRWNRVHPTEAARTACALVTAKPGAARPLDI